jgi:hypothetical protein
MPATDETGTPWTGFFLNSDRTKNKELMFIAREDFDLLIDEVLTDNIVEMEVDRIRGHVRKSRFERRESKSPISLNADAGLPPRRRDELTSDLCDYCAMRGGRSDL